MRLSLASAIFAAATLALPAGAADPFLRRTTTVEVVEKIGPSVVNITTERLVQQSNPFGGRGDDIFFDRFFRDFFEPRGPRKAKSLGSGVLIDSQGHVLTNEHVVGRADVIRVASADGREFDAELIGADSNNDLAVLRIVTDEKLPWIPLSTSADLMVGEPVIAIGNPFGLASSVTTGVISATNRSVRTDDHVYHGFLQTDASINPGNSGGPLLNAEGKLIGINTAVYGGGQGIGFAIPIDVAKRVVAELIEHGELLPVWLGLHFQDLSRELAASLDLPEGVNGALINRVRKKSPGGRAGLARGDVVTMVDRHPVRSARAFFEILSTVTPRQVMTVAFVRDGDEQAVKVTAEEFPDQLIDQLTEEMLGLVLNDHGGGFSVEAVREGGGAQRIGIREGDLLLAVNGRRLDSSDSLRRCIVELRGRDRALLVVQRGNGRYNVTVPLL